MEAALGHPVQVGDTARHQGATVTAGSAMALKAPRVHGGRWPARSASSEPDPAGSSRIQPDPAGSTGEQGAVV